jgi:hypothetical protein
MTQIFADRKHGVDHAIAKSTLKAQNLFHPWSKKEPFLGKTKRGLPDKRQTSFRVVKLANSVHPILPPFAP